MPRAPQAAFAGAGRRGLVAALAALAAAPALRAQPPLGFYATAAPPARPSSAQLLERRFLQLTAAGLRLRGDASNLALARSSQPAVQELARILLARQQSVQPELLWLLHRRGMALPILSNSQAKALRQLARLQGARFDRLYLEEVQRSLQADIANHEKLLAQAEDGVLRGWVDRQLPALRFALAQAGKLQPQAAPRGRQRAV